MIRADMIPDEVVEAACRAYTSIMLEVAPELAISEAIAAALNAWPGAGTDWIEQDTVLILPLPQEPRDE